METSLIYLKKKLNNEILEKLQFESIYNLALRLQNEGTKDYNPEKLQNAATIYAQISDYLDAKQKQNDCLALIEDWKEKEKIYLKYIDYSISKKNKVPLLIEAKEKLLSLKGYKNSHQSIEMIDRILDREFLLVDRIKFIISITYIISWLGLFFQSPLTDNETLLICWIFSLISSYCGTFYIAVNSKPGFKLLSAIGIFFLLGIFTVGIPDAFLALFVFPFLLGTVYSITFLFKKVFKRNKISKEERKLIPNNPI